ncbi:MAG: hypothetical protein JXB15_13010 [Anaerolineales bacterium]|nr:hypothetical protein [Anaerolineales bacterium]
MISHRLRLEACLARAKPDRVPVALWRHFPVDDQTPAGLARATLLYQRTYDFDLVKVTPASSFCLKDWGAQDEWHGVAEGTRDYTRQIIQGPEDWERLPLLDPYQGYLGEQIRCLQLITQELGPETPVLQTVFSPLAQAKNLVGKNTLLIHLRRYPEAVHRGLRIIAESTLRFIEAAGKTGIAGLFYAVQHAQYGLLTTDEYETFGKVYDLMVLEPARQMWLNMLHLHGEEIMFDLFTTYPVQVINWHDQDTWPSLQEGLSRFPGCVCGGLGRIQPMVLGTPDQVQAQAQTAIETTNGLRFILGTGCVVPITAPHGNISAARQSVEA